MFCLPEKISTKFTRNQIIFFLMSTVHVKGSNDGTRLNMEALEGKYFEERIRKVKVLN